LTFGQQSITLCSMPKRRPKYADALARLMFGKDAAELEPAERAELDVLRALDADASDEDRYEELAVEIVGPTEADTIH
jgi:hypothetical protein